jgi:leucyl aminopeptidase
MKRSLVFALMLSLGHASVAMAGETLLQSGKRITRQVTNAPPSRVQPLALQAQTTTLAQTGMRKRTKFLIAMGIAGAFAGVAIAVDRGVEDSTPSSLGQR